jgi:hypothetical protein
MYINKSWYSVIISLLLISFIIVLTAGVFRLVINEMKDNKVMWDYFKAYAWAESAQELALLEIKQVWYWYDKELKASTTANSKSVILAKESPFIPNRDVLISYYNNGKVNSYSWTLAPLAYDIIPLFYIDDEWEKKVNSVYLSVQSWVPNELSWNVIWKDGWISGIGTDLVWAGKRIGDSWFEYITFSLNDFLSSSTTNYLVLFNSGGTDIKYTLNSSNSEEFFTKPRLEVFSSWEMWEYKQNLKTIVDNTELLNILKYSIYSH